MLHLHILTCVNLILNKFFTVLALTAASKTKKQTEKYVSEDDGLLSMYFIERYGEDYEVIFINK